MNNDPCTQILKLVGESFLKPEVPVDKSDEKKSDSSIDLLLSIMKSINESKGKDIPEEGGRENKEECKDNNQFIDMIIGLMSPKKDSSSKSEAPEPKYETNDYIDLLFKFDNKDNEKEKENENIDKDEYIKNFIRFWKKCYDECSPDSKLKIKEKLKNMISIHVSFLMSIYLQSNGFKDFEAVMSSKDKLLHFLSNIVFDILEIITFLRDNKDRNEPVYNGTSFSELMYLLF